MMLPVNELFETIQGEGFWTGTPAVFVRLQGCPVGCPWCDTKHTWQRDPANRVTLTEALTKGGEESPTYADLDIVDIVEAIGRCTAKHVVITGGEPCVYDLGPLTRTLERASYAVQIETSGTHEVKCARNTWVTVSPKIGMPGGRAVLEHALHRADEIKHPIGRPLDYERLRDEILPHVRTGIPVYLQPLSLSPVATEYARKYAAREGFRVSLQTHRLAGIR